MTRTIEKGKAVWIPDGLFDRVVLELQMPVSCLKNLLNIFLACCTRHKIVQYINSYKLNIGQIN